jgi:3-oxoacyl-[acyl-carrier-protein] synthase-3
MRYENVCLDSIGFTLPHEVVASDELERQLEPLYTRLRLPEGRLELITGVCQRRFWPVGTLPSQPSLASARAAIAAAGVAQDRVGALIHASVCRDHLEPATACAVHAGLGLPAECMVFDLSNACLGLLNGVVQLASMIELGQIEAGLVVGTEGSRQVVETTIEYLNRDRRLTRRDVKLAMASLTLGSASCAMLLTHRSISRGGTPLAAVTVRANTRFHELCQSGRDEAVAGGMRPLMATDSERLMREGIATGADTFDRFLVEAGWSRADIDRTFCHQVGPTHRKLLFEALRLDPEIDSLTVQWLGNTGAVALPVTLALAAAAGRIASGQRLALLGIGSGINCLMLACQWGRTPAVASPESGPSELDA